MESQLEDISLVVGVTCPRREECFTLVWVGVRLLRRVLSTVLKCSSFKPSVFSGANLEGVTFDLELLVNSPVQRSWVSCAGTHTCCCLASLLHRSGSCDPQTSLNSPADSPLDLNHFTIACQLPLNLSVCLTRFLFPGVADHTVSNPRWCYCGTGCSW